MKRYLFPIIFTFLNSVSTPSIFLGQLQWTILDSFTTDELTAVYFTDAETGYTVGYDSVTWIGSIWKTMDGGDSWIHLAAPDSLLGPLAVHFTDANTGFVGSIGAILRTTNGGNDWSIYPIGGMNPAIHGIHFPAPNTGYAVGYDYTANSPVIQKTVNSGESWTQLNSTVNHEYRSIFCTDANTCYIVGWDGTILKTTNGGTSWEEQDEPMPVGRDLASVFFTDAETGYIVGGVEDYETIYKTTNGGMPWEVSRDSTGGFLLSVFFVDGDTGYAVGENGNLLETIDGGSQWNGIDLGITNELTSIQFPDNATGFVVGHNGIVIKASMPGGIKGTGRNRIPVGYSLLQNHPNPFNPSTSITFSILTGTGKSSTRLAVYDLRGRLVRTLIAEEKEPGTHQVHWDGTDEGGHEVSSGIYLYTLISGDYRSTRKMLVVR